MYGRKFRNEWYAIYDRIVPQLILIFFPHVSPLVVSAVDVTPTYTLEEPSSQQMREAFALINSV